MKWFKFPDENIKKNQVELDWQGEGWYCTTRVFPGSELYREWRIDDAITPDTDLNRQDHRDEVGRSFGGPLRYLASKPAEDG